MKNKITTDFEWCFETWDEHEDILDNMFFDNLKDAQFKSCDLNSLFKLVLVRSKYTEEESLIDRLWCYVKPDLVLSDSFCDELGNPIRKCLKKFVTEFDKWKVNSNG